MTNRTVHDVIVVGGGVIGLSVAWRLARQGVSVAVIDAGAVRPGATAAAAGMLAPSFETAPADPIAARLFAFGRRSLAQWRSFAEELEGAAGVDIDYRRDGILGAALTEREGASMEARVAALRAEDVACELLSAAEARTLEPSLGPRVIAACLVLGEGEVDSIRLLQSLKTAFALSGDVVHGRARAARAASELFHVDVAAPGGGARTLVAPKLVLATGAHARTALAEFGAAPPPIRPVKGEALALSTARAAVDRTPGRVVRGADAYICPKADGRIVIGATEVEGRWDAAPEDAAIEGLRRNAANICPGLAELAERDRWAGLRPGAPDGAPVLGAPAGGPPGLYLALGHYRNGVLFAPATADLMARAVLERPLSATDCADLAAFSPDRFGSGEGGGVADPAGR